MKLVSLKPIYMNGWVVQSSILNNDTICIILYNVDFNTAIVRYFDDEVKAHVYLVELIYGDCDVSEEGEN